MSRAGVGTLAFIASLAGGCASPPPRHPAPVTEASVNTGNVAEAKGAAPAPVALPALLKTCGSHVDFGAQYGTSWVEDTRQRLCCSPRTEGTGSHAGVWRFVAPEECVNRYAPGLSLPFVVVPDSAPASVEAAATKGCLPGVAVELVFPTDELEPRLDSGSRLRIESCVGANCAQAIVDFDSLARDDQLLFALEGSSKAGAILAWRAGHITLRLRVVQAPEQIAQGERFRLTLELDGKPLRAIETALAYQSSGSAPAPVSVGSPSQCPIALVSVVAGH